MKNLLEYYFTKRLKRERLECYLNRIVPEEKSSILDSEDIIVSCVQRMIKPVKGVEQYIDLVNSFVKEAAEKNSNLIVFPEYNFFDLLGLIPGFNMINKYLNKKGLLSRDASSSEGSRLLYTIFIAISNPIQGAIETIMCNLAEKYNINIYTGSYLIREKKQLFNGGSLISREGKLLGRQKKIHLTDFEELLGMNRANNINIFQLDIGKTACPICMDATYFETFNIARRLDCDIIILPIANNEEYSLYKALRGIWPRVQESHVYGLKSALNGWLCGMHFTGKAGIFAPLNLTKNRNGIILISRNYEGDFLVTDSINLEKLYRERKEAEYYGDVNLSFEKDYYKKTYKGDK